MDTEQVRMSHMLQSKGTPGGSYNSIAINVPNQNMRKNSDQINHSPILAHSKKMEKSELVTTKPITFGLKPMVKGNALEKIRIKNQGLPVIDNDSDEESPSLFKGNLIMLNNILIILPQVSGIGINYN